MEVWNKKKSMRELTRDFGGLNEIKMEFCKILLK